MGLCRQAQRGCELEGITISQDSFGAACQPQNNSEGMSCVLSQGCLCYLGVEPGQAGLIPEASSRPVRDLIAEDPHVFIRVWGLCS